ncbi:hypothetical protein [Thermus aquaticus]|uniref:Uncharacterized protein n=1 Tax=Thermus aquaticus (strain ATCC BAA-2747 / Y51MC23) TaxID=498848 RepID=A0ABM5VJK8_THEA5|nr:hypothetical protein [Thermus aquaticus]ALJ90059.1 hypothetical protein TO73_0194 [Thermus aquaticus Y51MC23]
MPRKDETQEVQEQEPRRPYEEWARELGTPGWLLAAAKTKAGWALGQEVTRKEYEAALKATQGEVIRNG